MKLRDDIDVLDTLEEMLKTGAEAARLEMDHDGDWDAIVFLVNDDKSLAMVPVQHLLTDVASKDMVGEKLIPMVIRKYGATAIGMIMSAWMVIVDAQKGVPDEELIDMLVPPSQHPQRREILMIGLADQTTQRSVHAEIKRPEGSERPELGPWETTIGESYGGRFWDEPLKALREEK